MTVGDRESTLSTPESTPPPELARDSSGLVRRPDRPNRSSAYALGMELTTLDAQLAERIDLPASWRGALVLTVDPESPLSAMVKPHDVISAIDNQAIQSAEQAVAHLEPTCRSRFFRHQSRPYGQGQQRASDNSGSMMETIGAAIERIVAGQSLTVSESHAAVRAMLDGAVVDADVAAYLTALREKGETVEELEGTVAAVRERMIPFDNGSSSEFLLDTCGTGGDGACTVNISTAAAIVVAACGVKVVKHGNRAASGNSGSSDVLTSLGVAIDPDLPLLVRGLAELNIAFLFAPRFHPGLRHVAPIRRQLPFRTLFNLVGPLCNPASPSYQLVGTPEGPQADLLADVLARLPCIRRAAVVSASDGLDEVTLDGPTIVRLVEHGIVRRLAWNPDDLGLTRYSAGACAYATRTRAPSESSVCSRESPGRSESTSLPMPRPLSGSRDAAPFAKGSRSRDRRSIRV